MTEHLDKDTRREQILDAAVKLFITQGYENSSVDEIAREAGLSKGSIYWYFKSKLEILFEITDRYVSNSQLEIVRLAELDKYGPEAFYKSHREMARMREMQPERDMLFGQLVALAGRHPEICDRLRGYHNRWIDTAADLVRSGIEKGRFRPVDPVLIAHAITAMYDGLYMRKQMEPDVDIVAVIETATRLMFEALTVDAPRLDETANGKPAVIEETR